MVKLMLEPPLILIGDYRYSATSGVLEIAGELIRLRSREGNMLNALIEHFPEILTREQIEAKLYQDSYATDATINQAIKRLRSALGDSERTLIRTIPKQGYVLSCKPQNIDLVVPSEDIAIPQISNQAANSIHGDDAWNEQMLKSAQLNLAQLDKQTKSNIVQTTEPTADSSEHKFSLARSTCFVIFSLLAILIGYAIADMTDYKTMFFDSATNTKFMFDASAEERQHFLISETDDLRFILKENSVYIICSYAEGVTQCSEARSEQN